MRFGESGRAVETYTRLCTHSIYRRQDDINSSEYIYKSSTKNNSILHIYIRYVD